MLHNPPKTISLLIRELKPSKTYKDFYKAWLPPVISHAEDYGVSAKYFNFPVQILNAQSLDKPQEIYNIGLMWADLQELTSEKTLQQSTEAKRHEEIENVADKIGETTFCKVLDINKLGE